MDLKHQNIPVLLFHVSKNETDFKTCIFVIHDKLDTKVGLLIKNVFLLYIFYAHAIDIDSKRNQPPEVYHAAYAYQVVGPGGKLYYR